MVSEIITDIQALNISVFAELLKKILIEIFKVILDLAGVEGLRLRGGIDAGSEHIGALVHVGEEKSRADAGLGVEPRAANALNNLNGRFYAGYFCLLLLLLLLPLGIMNFIDELLNYIGRHCLKLTC